jgi:hypothetical protein
MRLFWFPEREFSIEGSVFLKTFGSVFPLNEQFSKESGKGEYLLVLTSGCGQS